MSQLDLWIGTNKAHGSLRLKAPKPIEGLEKTLNSYRGVISPGWRRVAVLAGRAHTARFFIIEPAEDLAVEAELRDGDYFVRGAFRIVRVIATPGAWRAAYQAWQVWRPEALEEAGCEI